MSPSSTDDSPPSATGTAAPSTRHFPMPTRESFTIEMPNATLTAVPNGSNIGLKSPNDPNPHHTPTITREGILGAAQKARNAAQVSDSFSNGLAPSSDDGSNPLKRRNTDAGVDYPRRRATIAVRLPLVGSASTGRG